MTDLLDQNMHDAFLALLAADTSLTVFDGQVTNAEISAGGPVPPYAVVYFRVARPSDDLNNAVDGRSRVVRPTWTVHAVGGNAMASRAVAERVRTQLLDVRPTVAGFTGAVGPIRMAEPLPPRPDETTGQQVMDSITEYWLLATT